MHQTQAPLQASLTSTAQGTTQSNTVHMSGRGTALTGEWLNGGWTPSHPPGASGQKCPSSSCTADVSVPAEKSPQAGTSQPVRHARPDTRT